MNGKPILILDCQYLCYRAFHALGSNLESGGEPTATIFGFLKDVTTLLNEFSTDRIVFTWDRGSGKRREIYPEYKMNRDRARSEMDADEAQRRKDFLRQVQKLREMYIPQLGYRNSFWQDGYEADDVIASIVTRSLHEDDQAIIVSSDQDLWQLITENVSCYNPHKKVLMDRDLFKGSHDIEPSLWAGVKAIAGCTSDNVPGVRGVGEVTAVKWFQSKLKHESAAYKKISDNLDVYNRNIKLVRLPFEGVDQFEIGPDDTSIQRWRDLADKLNMRSIREMAPGMPRGIGKRQPSDRTTQMGFGF